MYDRILVPTDGSVGTAHVAMQAFDLAEQYEAAVHLLYVVNSKNTSVLSDGEDALRARGRRAIETLTELAENYDLEPVTEMRNGDPAEEILACANEIDADAIVMGTHGRSGLKRRLIGSVAEHVVRHSERPVLTVRLPETDRTITDEANAADVVTAALEAEGFGEVEVNGVEEQLSVWVVEVSADDTLYNVYVDPVTQRTSAIRRADSN